MHPLFVLYRFICTNSICYLCHCASYGLAGADAVRAVVQNELAQAMVSVTMKRHVDGVLFLVLHLLSLQTIVLLTIHPVHERAAPVIHSLFAEGTCVRMLLELRLLPVVPSSQSALLPCFCIHTIALLHGFCVRYCKCFLMASSNIMHYKNWHSHKHLARAGRGMRAVVAGVPRMRQARSSAYAYARKGMKRYPLEGRDTTTYRMLC